MSLLDEVRWQRLEAPLPPGINATRAGHATAVLGDYLYLHGGRIEYEPRDQSHPMPITLHRDVVQRDFLRLHVPSSTWQRLADPPAAVQPRYYHTLTRVDDQLILLGGAKSTSKICDAAVFCYNPATSTWSQLPLQGEPSLLQRTAHAAAPHPSRATCLVVAGGYGGHGANAAWLNDIVLLNTATGEVARLDVAPSLPRTYHSLSTVGRFLVVIGGRTTDPLTSQDRLITGKDVVAVLDVAKNEWLTNCSIAGAAPLPRSSHRASVHGANTVLVFGGAGRTRMRLGDLVGLRVVEQRGRVTLTWIHPQGTTPPGLCVSKATFVALPVTHPSTGRAAHSLDVWKDTLVVVGGYGDKGSESAYRGDMWTAKLDIGTPQRGVVSPWREKQPAAGKKRSPVLELRATTKRITTAKQGMLVPSAKLVLCMPFTQLPRWPPLIKCKRKTTRCVTGLPT